MEPFHLPIRLGPIRAGPLEPDAEVGGGLQEHYRLGIGLGVEFLRAVKWLDRALRINSLSPEESAVAYHYAQGLDNAQIDEAQDWPRLKANGHGVNFREEVAGYLA